MNEFPFTFSGKQHSEETKAKMSIARKRWHRLHPNAVSKWQRGRKLSKVTREKISLSVKRAHVEGRLNTLHFRKQHSLFMKKRFANRLNNPWYGRRGKLSPVWNGGSSFEPYDAKFNDELKEAIRNRFKRLCMMCFKPEGKIKLVVHHIDYDKKNNFITNLVPLHNKCHVKTNNGKVNRLNWKKYFREVIRCRNLSAHVTMNQISDLVDLRPN